MWISGKMSSNDHRILICKFQEVKLLCFPFESLSGWWKVLCTDIMTEKIKCCLTADDCAGQSGKVQDLPYETVYSPRI